MSELAVDNRLVLSGSLSKAPEIRYSPAGVPIARFTLQHQSRQQQAEMPRQVVCNILVIASGESVVDRYRASSLCVSVALSAAPGTGTMPTASY